MVREPDACCQECGAVLDAGECPFCRACAQLGIASGQNKRDRRRRAEKDLTRLL